MLMVFQNVTASKLAKDIGFNMSLIWKWEKKPNCKPNAKTLSKLCDYFQVSEDWLINGEGNIVPEEHLHWPCLERKKRSSKGQKMDKACIECNTIEAQDMYGRAIRVRKLGDDVARAKINVEYGFEYDHIKITGVCWYKATNMNYFRFEVKCREYEVWDFGDLEIVD